MRRGIGLVVAVMAMWACTAQQGNMKTASRPKSMESQRICFG